MYTTVSHYDFHDAFNASSYKDNFSYEALTILFNFFGDENIELDIVAIACEYQELTIEEAFSNYDYFNAYVLEAYSEDEALALVTEFFEANTTILGMSASDTFVIEVF
jgi:hypothetical protein